MAVCILCTNELNERTKPEHILLSALGGRKTTQTVLCSDCNGRFGSTIDDAIAQEVAVIRNMLQLNSGTGRPPPMIKNVASGTDRINLTPDGRPELVTRPFTVHKHEDGHVDIQITTKSAEEAARFVPDMAAQLGCSVEQLLELLTEGTGSFTTRKPDTVHHRLGFGDPLALRSVVKSALVLWATRVGNDEVRSSPYRDARSFVLNGGEDFNRTRMHLDFRDLPHLEALKRGFGPFFNMIYIRSNDVGRVLAHFTLYNLLSRQIVLAEVGGTPNIRTALISNPLRPASWSDSIADEIDIDFAWLDAPDYAEAFERVPARFNAAIKHYGRSARARELGRIADDVFAKYGIVDDEQPISDPDLAYRIHSEIARRAASYVLNLPHDEELTGDELVARLKAHLKPPV